MENEKQDRTPWKEPERTNQPHFNSDMLRLAREFCGMTKKELADEAKVSASFITSIEDGIKHPSMETLGKLANATGFPIDHFFSTGRFEAAPTSMFRKRKTITQAVLRGATARIAVLTKCLKELLSEVDAPPHKLPRLDPDETPGGVSVIAQTVRRVFRVPDGPIRNLTEILEDNGILVIPFDFGTLKIDGCSDWIDGWPVILFNPNVPKSRRRHTLAHELGHLVMHESIHSDDHEDEADAFAGCFNMPEDQIRSQLVPFNIRRLAGLKAHWKSSMAAILHRASDLGVVTDRQVRYFWMNLRKISAHGNEPHEDLIPLEKPRLLADLVASASASAELTPEDLHRFLRIPKTAVSNLFPINGYLRAV